MFEDVVSSGGEGGVLKDGGESGDDGFEEGGKEREREVELEARKKFEVFHVLEDRGEEGADAKRRKPKGDEEIGTDAEGPSVFPSQQLPPKSHLHRNSLD